jgi:hypothetical protein
MSYAEDRRERSVSELVAELSEEISTLLRKEAELAGAGLREEAEQARLLMSRDVELAKEELADTAREGGRAAGMLGGAGVAALAVVGAVTTCAVMLLDRVMPNWLAALIVAVVWALVGFALFQSGRQALRRMGSPLPTRAMNQFRQDFQETAFGARARAGETIESIKEDVEWAKTANGSAGT